MFFQVKSQSGELRISLDLKAWTRDFGFRGFGVLMGQLTVIDTLKKWHESATKLHYAMSDPGLFRCFEEGFPAADRHHLSVVWAL